MSDVTFEVNPSGRVPLTARATFTLDEAALATIEIEGPESSWVQTSTSAYQMEHSVMVLGLQSDQTYQIVLVATDRAGNEVKSSPHDMTTPALPSDFPPVEAVQSEPDRMEPGVTLFSVFRRTEDDPGNDFGLILAVNGAGEVVWYYRSNERITDVRRLQNGNLLYTGGAKRDRMYEIDMLGHMVRQWHAAAVGGDAPPGSIPVATDTLASRGL